MTDDLALNRERLLQNRTTRQQDVDVSAAKLPTASTGAAAGLLIGLQVFDSVSGDEGTVEAINQLRPGGVVNVVVRLDNGGLVVRGPEHLIVRPPT